MLLDAWRGIVPPPPFEPAPAPKKQRPRSQADWAGHSQEARYLQPEPGKPPPSSHTWEEQLAWQPWKYFPPREQLRRAAWRAKLTEEQRQHDAIQATRYGRERWEQMLREDPLLINPNRPPKPQCYPHTCDGCGFSITTEESQPPWGWRYLRNLHQAFDGFIICQRCKNQLRREVCAWILLRRAALRVARHEGRRFWPRQPKRRFVRSR